MGSEDYSNDAWGLSADSGLYPGGPIAEGTRLGYRISAYRWHLNGPIPFTRSLRFEIEHARWTYNADGTVHSGFEERADYFALWPAGAGRA
jgi:Protein of unknown function (DUF2961)